MHLLLIYLPLVLQHLPLTTAAPSLNTPPNPGLPSPWPPSNLPIHEGPTEWYHLRTSLNGHTTLQCPLDWPSECASEASPNMPEHFFASVNHPIWWYLGHSHDYYLPHRDGHKSDASIFPPEQMRELKARNLNITQERLMFGNADDLPRPEMRIFALPDNPDWEGCCEFGWSCWFHIAWWQDVRNRGGFGDEKEKERIARDKAYCCFYRYEKSCRAPRYVDSWLENFTWTEPGMGRCVDREMQWVTPAVDEEQRHPWTGAGD